VPRRIALFSARRHDLGASEPFFDGESGIGVISCSCWPSGAATLARADRLEETAMHYLSFLTDLNPYVLAILAAVLACGAVDWWIKTH
jgi:hypothetical protein